MLLKPLAAFFSSLEHAAVCPLLAIDWLAVGTISLEGEAWFSMPQQEVFGGTAERGLPKFMRGLKH